ncbi:MAG: DUF1972 domain-containing protein [Bacilli bacterium]|nr:DUF1972 domain-containing protein [Bacilli bacterium]
MKKNIFIVGSRGYHYNYGGWETFVTNLVDNYNDINTNFYISMITDDKQVLKYKPHNNITVNPIYVKNKGSIKMLVYPIKAMNYYLKYIEENKINNAYIYVLGLKLFNYLQIKRKTIKRLGIKILVNPDGLEHERSKWSYPIKKFFLLSEKLMLNNCDLIICDALGIKDYINNKYPKLKNKTTYIAYGTNKIDLNSINESKILKDYKLKKDNYILVVGRCVPENNLELIIKDFMNSNTNKELLIITNLSNGNYYEKLVDITQCNNDKRIKFIDGIYDEKKLACIRKNAYLYIHGHSVGGTNPSLLEALSLTDLNILYDVCFNHDVGKDSCLYFKDTGSLTKLLNNKELLDKNKSVLGKKAKNIIKNNYTWEIIVNKYKSIFK